MPAPRVLVVLDTISTWSRGVLRGFAHVAHERRGERGSQCPIGFGFPDYYNWSVWTSIASPNSVMVAGRATLVTDWDTWMLRHTYNQLKSRL